MAQPPGEPRTAAPRWWRRHRLALAAAALVVVVLLSGAAWVLVSALRARSALNRARTDVQAVQNAIENGDPAKAQAMLRRVVAETKKAHRSTTGPAWWISAQVPLLGSSLRTTRGLAATVDALARGPLTRVVGVSESVSPGQVLRDGVVSLPDVDRARRPVAEARDETRALVAQANSLPSGHLLGPVAKARTQLLDKLDGFSRQLDGIADAVTIGPDMLGAHGRRTYLLAFQNSAEIKATGGIIGVYGVLTTDNGRIHLAHVGSDNEFVNSPTPVVDLGAAYTRAYGAFFPTTFWLNANVSPHFPYAARIWRGLYEKQSGTKIDGVIGLDPVALADVLKATGPVRLPSGERVDAGNVARLVEVDAYRRYDETTQREQRKAFLSSVARSVFDAALHNQGSSQELIRQLGAASRTRHLQAWSARLAEQATFARYGYAGEVYQGRAPYAAIVLDNVQGAKLDYYVERKVTYSLGRCGGAARPGRIGVTLTNTAPPGLPVYVTDRIDRPRGTYPVGQSRLYLSLDLTAGARATGFRVNGRRAAPVVTAELGHPRLSAWVLLDPGQPLTVTVDTLEPATTLRPVVPVQPMARDQATHVTWTPC